MARLLDVDGTRLVRYEADGTATIVASWGEPTIVPAGTRIALDGRNIASLVRSSGRPARIEDYENAPGSVAAIARERGVRSAVGAPITVEARLWGAMVAFSKVDKPLPSGIELRLADFTDLVGTAIANTQARVDLTASRARVVAATDDIRRRIERDLHDGTQQRLVSLALDVRRTQASVPDTQPQLRIELADIADGLVAALDDLREISRGIHPALLARGGLGPVLKALARRSPLPVELDINLDGRLPDHVEVAAYYVVAEALTNAAKHARPTAIWVAADVVDGRTATNAPVFQFIRYAFNVRDFQVEGGPDWIKTDRYDINAKSNADSPPVNLGGPDPIQPMLKALLVDRFKLAAHIESRDRAIYALVAVRADKSLGSKIAPSSTD